MMYALDTNIVSFWLRGLYNLESQFDTVLKAGHTLIIPPMTYYEILRGLYAHNSSNKLQIFEAACLKLGLQDMTKGDWVQAAKLYAECRKINHTMEDADLLQAAFCLQNRYTLVTHNPKHFIHINTLTIEDWTNSSSLIS
ncbi:PIN domain-containing protein [Treponema primitia]|uniref:PIN domain-containing protein n=1 Tax=Treponema primitia TaxID=88058 RepID=UPI0039808AAB